MTASFAESLPIWRQSLKALVTCLLSSVDGVEDVDSQKKKSCSLSSTFTFTMKF